MKLVIEAAHKAGIIVDDPDSMSLDGGFIIRVPTGSEDNFKRIKTNSRFYLYIEDTGDIGQTGGIFKHQPAENETTSLSAFRDAAVFAFSLEPRRSIFGKEKQKETHRASMGLKGSRCFPTYLIVKKIDEGKYDAGGGRVIPYAFISGKIYYVNDPRLHYLSPHETTEFGKGQFDIDNVKVLPDGNFVHLVLSPYSEQIEKIVDQQIDAFNHYSSLYSEANVDPEEKEVWVSKYEHTRKVLKPHANEIYKYKEGVIYYINSGGNWQCDNVRGLRDIDVDDRQRVYQYLASESKLEEDLKPLRQTLSRKALQEQKKLQHIASALQPAVLEKRKDDLDVLDRRQKKYQSLKPTDGPLGTNDLAGLKEGVTLFPHQAMLLAAMKDRNRFLVDADPGAGKALLIICDILQQMKLYKLKRPLVLMPESLLPQFAREVRHFSELNPWIISTESIKKWGKTGQLPEFVEDAKRAPRNTVFITSYNWLSLEPEYIDNGEVSESAGKIKYKKSKIFNKVDVLLNRLGIDAVYSDECHLLRGASNMARAAFGLAEVPIVRGLTGTVMAGNPYDVTASMSPIHSSVFGTKDDFINEYTARGSINEYKPNAPKAIRKKLQDFGILSVRRSAWAHLLPKTHREFHFVEFTEAQRKAYTALLVNILDEIRKDPVLSVLLKKIEDALERGDEITAGPLLARFTPLDVFLNSPAEAKDWLKSLMVGDNAISPKAKIINTIIKEHLAHADSGKVLVFVQYKEAARNLLDNLSPELRSQASYYEGGMIDVLMRFKTPQDPLKILFAVDKSLVVGHNLQAANCIIHADLKWKPGDLAQREARAARIGQKRDVYIHTVLVKGTAEILKMARNISAEHLIAKANSDFDDKTMLQPIQMTLSSMQTFTEEHQVKPYLKRKKTLDAHIEEQSVKERDLYGPTMMRPHGYTSISKVFKEAKELKKVPSAKDFVGTTKDHESLVMKDLDSLPDDPKHPKYLTLDIMQWDDDWFLYSYKSADPSGFLRNLGFTLMRGYYYLELTSKAEVQNIIKKLEKNIVISNKPEFEQQVRETRVTSQGSRGGLRKAAQKSKLVASSKDDDDYIDKSKLGEVSLQFSTMDGAPVIWVYDILSPSDTEFVFLKKIGFELEPALWRKPITRTQIKTLLTKIQTNYPQVRIANWEDFKSIAELSFKGLNLTEFDVLAKKK